MLDAANYCAIEKLRDGRDYIIRAQRRDDDIIEALHLRAGLRTFYLCGRTIAINGALS